MPKPIPNQEDEDPTPYLFVSLEQRRIDQSKPYDSKKSCWIPDEKEGYLLGEIKATKGDIVSVGLQGGEVITSYMGRDIIKERFIKIGPAVTSSKVKICFSFCLRNAVIAISNYWPNDFIHKYLCGRDICVACY